MSHLSCIQITTGAPPGDILGQINPLSRRSSNGSFSSCSVGAIVQGGMVIGWVPELTSIPKSITLSVEAREVSQGTHQDIHLQLAQIGGLVPPLQD